MRPSAFLVAATLALGAGLVTGALIRSSRAEAIGRISAVLDRAAVGDFAARTSALGSRRGFGGLAVRLNRTLRRMQALTDWMKETADHLAHDARTPLSRASARLDSLIHAPDPGERERLGQEAGRDLEQVGRALEAALALRDEEVWRLRPVRLDHIVARIIDLYRPVADGRSVLLTYRGAAVAMSGVPSLLDRAVASLIEDALTRTPEGGAVSVIVFRDGDGAGLSISAPGAGFRDGPSSVGSVVQAVVRRHDGRVTIDDAASATIVTVRFPR